MNDRYTGTANRRPGGATPPHTSGASRRAAQQARGFAAKRPGGRRAAPERRWRLLQWALVLLLGIYTALVVGANATRDVELSAVAAYISRMTDVSGLEAGDENEFQERFGVSPEGCEGWLLFGAGEIMNVSELMIAKGDDATLARLEEAAQARIDSQLTVFRGYGAEQTELLERAALWQRGNYLFYGVGEPLDQWEDAFLSCVR